MLLEIKVREKHADNNENKASNLIWMFSAPNEKNQQVEGETNTGSSA